MLEYVTTDPRVSGLPRPIGSKVAYVVNGNPVTLWKYAAGNTNWCTAPIGGLSGSIVTTDPRTGGLAAPIGTIITYVNANAAMRLRKHGASNADWCTDGNAAMVLSASGSYVSTGGGGPHTHEVADVNGLGTQLSGKADTAHSHDYAATIHAHEIAEVVGLGTALAGKASTAHAHTIADVTNLQTSLDGKAATSHGHAQSDVTNLVSDLAAKAPLASPTLTGTPAAPTASPGTNTTQIATTAFVTAAVAAGGGGGFSRPWFGAICGAYADGDPGWLMQAIQRGGNVAPTPTNIGTTVARCAFFRLPANLVVNKIRYYGVGATTNVFRCAIYRYSTLARLTAELPFTTVANAWGAAGTGLNLTLTKDTLYFIAVSVNATGTVAGLAAFGGTIAATTGMIATAPQSLPGNLDMDADKLGGYQAQFAVTAGALPATAPAMAAQAAWVGGFPALWLDSNNA